MSSFGHRIQKMWHLLRSTLMLLLIKGWWFMLCVVWSTQMSPSLIPLKWLGKKKGKWNSGGSAGSPASILQLSSQCTPTQPHNPRFKHSLNGTSPFCKFFPQLEEEEGIFKSEKEMCWKEPLEFQPPAQRMAAKYIRQAGACNNDWATGKKLGGKCKIQHHCNHSPGKLR